MTEQPSKLKKTYLRFYYALIFLLAFGLLYTLYPKEGRSKYDFQQGKPWLYETLIATFDFPILKSEAVINAEKDSVESKFVPYFNYLPDVGKSQIEKLSKDITQLLTSQQGPLDTLYRDSVLNNYTTLLNQIYTSGIIESSPELFAPIKGKKKLKLVKNGVASEIPITAIYSLKSAYNTASEAINSNINKADSANFIYSKISIQNYITSNIKYDKEKSDIGLEDNLKNVSTTRGVIPTGARIISKGDIVTSDLALILESFNTANSKQNSYGGWFTISMIGNMLFILFLMFILIFYLQTFNTKVFRKKRNYTLIMTIIVVMFLVTRIVYETEVLSIYIIPFCILPLIIRIFLGSRMAIFIHLISILMLSGMATNSFEFIVMQTMAGSIAVMSLNKLQKRGNLVITAGLVLVTYTIIYLAFMLAKEGNFNLSDYYELKWMVGSSVFLLLTYLIIYLFEKIFGFVSDVTLMELADTNNPLLRKLAEEAPGTFQHSMQVANLAEELAIKTGGNTMLIRTGALYHDIGKIASAQYFIENQSKGISPHEELSYVESAKKIINHVFDGVKMAKKHNLPEQIIDFIKMHHGESMAKYFYLKHKEENPDSEINIKDFSYPGPNPTSRETAMVMLVDGVEAASRSLPEKNEESLKKIINQIIDNKVNNHELDNAPITFKDIKDFKEILLEKLKHIYHIRIEYPKEK